LLDFSEEIPQPHAHLAPHCSRSNCRARAGASQFT
jgi:hypothetical protein